MTDADKLKELIDGHHAAMRFLVEHPDARLEMLVDGVWTLAITRSLCGDKYVHSRPYHRLAPTPRLVPLDQSDFLGEGRVTHLRRGGSTYNSFSTWRDGLCFGDAIASWERYDYATLLRTGVECSRDHGATFSACSKPAPTST